jgi:hypothetical protein
VFGRAAQLVVRARNAQQENAAAMHLDVVVGALDLIVADQAHADLLGDPRIIEIAARVPVVDDDFIGDFIDRADIPRDALGHAAIFLGGDAAGQQDEAVDHGDIHLHEAAIHAGAEQAGLHLGCGGRVVERLEQGPVGHASAQQRGGHQEAGEHACGHR